MSWVALLSREEQIKNVDNIKIFGYTGLCVVLELLFMKNVH